MIFWTHKNQVFQKNLEKDPRKIDFGGSWSKKYRLLKQKLPSPKKLNLEKRPPEISKRHLFFAFGHPYSVWCGQFFTPKLVHKRASLASLIFGGPSVVLAPFWMPLGHLWVPILINLDYFEPCLWSFFSSVTLHWNMTVFYPSALLEMCLVFFYVSGLLDGGAHAANVLW